jgi:hypothetical protein
MKFVMGEKRLRRNPYRAFSGEPGGQIDAAADRRGNGTRRFVFGCFHILSYEIGQIAVPSRAIRK